MESVIIYLSKSAGILFLFLGCYQLFLRKETLFNSNRWFLLSGVIVALILPLTYYTEIVSVPTDIVGMDVENPQKAQPLAASSFSWSFIIFSIYMLGTLFFVVKLVIELYTVFGYIKNGSRTTKGDYIHIWSTEQIKPFSFFKFIIYNPDSHRAEDLELILAHEQVHTRQRHSIDILLMEVVFLTQWFNPVAWLYKSAIKQNLEFLADTQNAVVRNNRKQYQYLLLRQSVDTGNLSIINPFFNSLIKKRIVMINQIPSRKIKAFKTLIILPFLALFFFSFNVKTEYRLSDSTNESVTGKSIELTIDKNTTENELAKIKKDLQKDGIDFTYTVKHNDMKEIVAISISISGKGNDGATFNNSYNSSKDDKAITPLVIFIDQDQNLVSIGSKGAYHSNSVHIDSDDGHLWMSSDGESHRDVRIMKKNGKKLIMVDGKEMTEEEFEKMDMHMGGASSRVFIHTDSDDEHDIKVIEDEGNGFFFIDTDGDEEPVFVIDGKESTAKKVKQLDPSEIESIDISKGEKALERFGEKGKNGVVEITTKKN